MIWLTIVTAIATFAATNIDDIFLLMLFFSQTPQIFHPRHIVLGQYLGFVGLVAISLLGFLGSSVIPPAWIGLLGIAPIAIGLNKLIHLRQNTLTHPPLQSELQSSRSSGLASMLSPKTYSVAAVTFANGGDNIGIYTPLFASMNISQLVVTLLIFLTLVAVWCVAGYFLIRQPSLARILDRYGHILVPFVLIALGLYIIIENETLMLLGL